MERFTVGKLPCLPARIYCALPEDFAGCAFVSDRLILIAASRMVDVALEGPIIPQLDVATPGP